VSEGEPWRRGNPYERGVYSKGPKAGRTYFRPRYDAKAPDGRFWIELSDFSKHFDFRSTYASVRIG
jgi:hypothetical protein